MELIMFVAMPATVFVSVCIGYLLGQHKERVEWNRLIEDGILPRPLRK